MTPWLWVICDATHPHTVHDRGVQHTRLYASARDIAAERIAAHAHRVLTGAGDVDHLAGVVCRVKRLGVGDWQATASGEVWARRIQARR